MKPGHTLGRLIALREHIFGAALGLSHRREANSKSKWAMSPYWKAIGLHNDKQSVWPECLPLVLSSFRSQSGTERKDRSVDSLDSCPISAVTK